ncbi:MAG: DNA primase [Pseudomonadales bacterium]
MRIPQSYIDDLNLRIDLHELISRYIRLTRNRKGADSTALCPFHDEKSASFTVSNEKQFYYCFGCGASGKAIDWLVDYDQIQFRDAVKKLAGEYGLEFTFDDDDPKAQEKYQDDKEQNDKLLAALKSAGVIFKKNLRKPIGKAAIEDLKSRGITGEISKRFEIGYAADTWQDVKQQLSGEFDENILILAGLVSSGDNNYSYDFFNNRIMLPIFNPKGELIAFGGRILRSKAAEGSAVAKYMNSPDTPVFNKSKILYNLHSAKQFIARQNCVFVVEGYMDVIAHVQYDIENTVAPLGTAFGIQQIELLKRHSSNMTFCFDGDRAGRSAAWRVVENAIPVLNDGINLQFLFFPDGEDPDSMVRKEGIDLYRQRLSQTMSMAEFVCRYVEDRHPGDDPAHKGKMAKEVFELLKKMPKGIYKHLLIKKFADEVGVCETLINDLIKTH